jgi:hypothetical protein
MLSGESTFTKKEITDILVGEGLEVSSDEFQAALRQRFIPTDTLNEKGESLYIES